MSVENYGILKGIVNDTKKEVDFDTPHYQLDVIGEDDKHYRCAINVMSSSAQSEVLYYADEKFDASEITHLQKLVKGYTPINENESNQLIALDYVRGKLFDPTKMIPLPHEVTGKDNDLNDFIEKYMNKAIKENATVYIYGSKFGPENKKDKIFGFKPTNGMHNIHMNQGNSGRWKKDNGIYHDGGILIQFDKSWVAIFLAFLSQSWCTNKQGHPTKFCAFNDPDKKHE
ncbi:YukJ family protein [Bacillus inaquosorum]|uniref:YukJ family protein n=1 Tax=Bacillus inaquosorum TaxID=483913 RepID=UPI00227E9D18|nr:YukJ family protein [Bacillus inaquosorum]MCY7756396.1 YukJ family protein [Bacillus inaquosorum]MCY8732996.1 YukJ family protein [Bacillus inaquosorum]MCY9033745.1 YukJ family protein [Bacillus inaquosorum]MCY9272533.1 YukJ family protein [Bacillus inaquosorum]MED0798371.1 YukJ family protein [Bacillus inaquosorum]